MGEEHKGLADPLEGPPPYLVKHNRQDKRKESGKPQEENIKVQGVPDNQSGGVALKEKFEILKPVERAAEHSQAVIETFKGYDDIRVGTVAVDKGIEGRRQQQQIPVGMGCNIVNKALLLLCHFFVLYTLYSLTNNNFLL
jgi:hypothetical protein